MPASVWYKLLAADNSTVIAEDKITDQLDDVADLRRAVYNATKHNLPANYDHINLHVFPPNTTNFTQPAVSATVRVDTIVKSADDIINVVARPPAIIQAEVPAETSQPSWPEPRDSGSQYTIETVVIEKSEFSIIRQSNGFLIDKSMLIYEFIRGSDSGAAEASLLLRPRRFGKTLNASMICSFVGPFADRSLFRGLAINEKEEFVKQHLGQYACIRISLLSCVSSDWNEHILQIKGSVASVYKQHKSMIEPYLDAADRSLYESILNKGSDAVDLQSSLLSLTSWYFQVYGRQSVIIMDEYDQGMQAAIQNVLQQRVNDHSEYNWDAYEMYAAFYRGFLTSTFKDNSNLFRGMLVGVSRVARTGMLSGLNNLHVFTLQSDEFSDKYGFAEEEVRVVCDRFRLQQVSITMDELKAMYNGYTAGTNAPRAIFNPWSIMSMVRSRDATTAHWSATGSLKLIQHVFMASTNNEFRNQLSQLINNGTITNVDIDQDIDYHHFALQDVQAVWNLLYHAGYLTRVITDTHSRGDAIPLRLPNKEVTDHFKAQVDVWYRGSRSFIEPTTILTKLLNGDVTGFRSSFVDAFERCTSFHDFTKQPNERFYHVFALGLFIAALQRGYNCIESNREAGYGRFDLLVMPASRDAGDRAAIVEFKASKADTDLEADASNAWQQIVERKYNTQVPDWCTKIDHYGIAFYRKSSHVLTHSYNRAADRSSEWTAMLAYS